MRLARATLDSLRFSRVRIRSSPVRVWAIGAFVFCGIASAWAREVPPPPRTHLYDETGLVSAEARQRIEGGLAAFEKGTTHQVVVAVFSKLGGEDIEGFATRVFEAWRIGKSGKDNGVLLALTVEEKRVRIEVGYGLESVLTDARSRRIIDQVMVPSLRQNMLNTALVDGAVAITEAISNPNARSALASGARPAAQAIRFSPAVLVIFLIVLIYVLRHAETHVGGHHYRRRRGSGGWRIGGGGFGGGFGGGGFSGGGGRSGGGGASGSW